MGWVRFTGYHSLGIQQQRNTETGYGVQGKPGDLVVLAEVEGVAARPGEVDHLPHYCTKISPWILDQVRACRRAGLAGKATND